MAGSPARGRASSASLRSGKCSRGCRSSCASPGSKQSRVMRAHPWLAALHEPSDLAVALREEVQSSDIAEHEEALAMGKAAPRRLLDIRERELVLGGMDGMDRGEIATQVGAL